VRAVATVVVRWWPNVTGGRYRIESWERVNGGPTTWHGRDEERGSELDARQAGYARLEAVRTLLLEGFAGEVDEAPEYWHHSVTRDSHSWYTRTIRLTSRIG